MLSEFLSTVNFAFSVTGPIFTMVVLGGVLKYYRLIGDAFIDQASVVVFKVSLPVLLGMSMVKTDIATVFDPVTIANASLSTLLVFVLLSLTAFLFVKNPRDKGVYVQGAFRGNLAIVGLAFCANLYGDEGIAKVLAIPECMWDKFAKKFFARFGHTAEAMKSRLVQSYLSALAWMLFLDTCRIECRHSALRRLIMVRSISSRAARWTAASAKFMLLRQRIIERGHWWRDRAPSQKKAKIVKKTWKSLV